MRQPASGDRPARVGRLALSLVVAGAGTIGVMAACESSPPAPRNRVLRSAPVAPEPAQPGAVTAPPTAAEPVRGAAQAPARGARRGCTSEGCHGDFMPKLAGQGLHFADVGTRCEDCHDKHGLVGVLKLKKNEPELCLDCHQDAAEFAKGEHVHGAGRGKCSDCHAAHASHQPKLLVAAGSELCLRCHDRAAFEGENVHAPVAEGCTGCHGPHANATAEGLTQPVPELCAKCHDGSEGKFKEAHGGYDLAATNCSSCHAAHKSSAKGLVRRVVHSPVADGECGACHVEPSEVAPAAKPALLVPVNKLCAVCHGEKCREFGARAGPHAPVKEGKCTECHAVHASDHDRLLSADASTTCLKCHDVRGELAALGSGKHLAHPPVVEGRCLECHDAHGGDDKRLLKESETELCLRCHEPLRASLDRENVHAPLELCTTCHDGHGSPITGQLRTATNELCLKCHPALAERLKDEKPHQPVGLGRCMDCHDPHASDRSKLLLKEPAALCATCHADVVDEKKGGSVHTPVVKGECLSCHDAHSSAHRGLLSKSAETLCTSCHGLTAQAIAAAPVKHPPAAAGACLACHGAHATANEHLLTQPAKETCRACHPEVLSETTQPGFSAHPPARDGECSACHVAHGSEHAGLVKQAIPALCIGCHDPQKPGFAEKHLGLATDTTDCSNCHAPHAAPGEGLFWPHRHTPFAEQKCEECHGAKK